MSKSRAPDPIAQKRFLGKWTALAGLLGLTSRLLLAQTVPPYTTDFESAQGYTLGALAAQDGWQVPKGTATVTNAAAFSGTFSVGLLPDTGTAQITHAFATFAGATVTYIDFYARLSAANVLDNSSTLAAEGSQVGLVRLDAAGHILVFIGDGSGGGRWALTGRTVALDANGQALSWTRFTIRQDYSTKKWDLYINGQMALPDIGFLDNTKTYFSQFALTSTKLATSFFDYFYVGSLNPLFANQSNDGIDDAWKTAHGFDPAVNSRNADPDGDGLINVEEYCLGTDPTKADTDGDGMPDGWEVQHGLNPLVNDAATDPGEVERTALQSYQQGLSPWPTPTVADGLQAWFRADKGVTKDAGNKVSAWRDVSSHNLSVAQTADATRQPVWVASATYGQPAVQFDGTTFLRTPGLVDEQAGNNDVTVIAVAIPGATQPAYGSLVDLSSDTARGFVVGQQASNTNQFQLWFTDAAQTGWYSSPAIGAAAGLTQVFSVVKSGTNATGYLNGASQGTVTVPAAMLSPVAALAVGNRASGSYGYNGQIAEVLIYNRALSDTERSSIEAALMTKYINPDADGNGLPDAWEIQYLGHAGNVASSDPGGVGRTLLQSYQQNLSPWPTAAVASGLRSWFKAELGVQKDANNKVSQWTDLSGHGSHVVQVADATKQPLWVATATNSQPVVQFDGTTFLKTAAAVDEQAGSNDVTVITVAVPAATQPAYASLVDLSSDTAKGFVVGQLATNTNQFQLWFMDAAQAGWNSSPAAGATAGQTQVITVVKNGTNAASYLNGTAQGTATVPAAMLDPAAALAVGNRASGSYGYNGQIAEVLIYNRALSDTERSSIESALMTKYINPDADGNGLPDAWEIQYLGHTGNDAASDPGGAGRTLLQSYQQSLSPWPAPTVASGLRSWFRASLGVVKDASNNVSQWTDLSGNSSHVRQTGALAPLWVGSAINSQPAIQFNGTTFLKTKTAVDETAGSNDLTVIAVAVPAATQPAYASLVDLSSDTAKGFVVGQLGTSTNQFQLWFMDAAQAGWNSGPAAGATAGATQVITVVKSGTNAASYLNGTAQGAATVPAAMLDPVAALAVGNRASGTYGYNGQIAEVLVYNRALSDAERQQVEAVLTAKYITPPFNPTAISGLRLYLKADSGVTADSSGNVSVWADQSNLHNDATQLSAALQPVMVANAMNGRPVVRFTGSNGYLLLGNLLAGATAGEIFAVLRNSTATPTRNNNLWYFTRASYHPLQDKTVSESFASDTDVVGPIPTQALDQPHLYNVSGQSGAWASWINGALYQSKSTNTVPVFYPAPQLGWAGYGGDMAEVIIYDHALTPAEREAVGRYLNQRYAFVPAAPAAPTNLTASVVSDTQVSLAWSGAMNGSGTIYTVERKTAAGTYAQLAEMTEVVSYFDATAQAGTTYTYRVKARNLAGASGYSNEATATTSAAGGVALPLTGMRLWLKADAIASTGPVGLWFDQSGNHNDAAQFSTAAQPQLVANALNGRPVVRFDGVDDYLNLTAATMSGATQGEVLVVLRTATAPLTDNAGLWTLGMGGDSYYTLTDGTIYESFGSNTNYLGLVPVQALNQYHLYDVSARSGSWMSLINGTPYVTKTTNTVSFNTSSPVLGKSSRPFNGDIAEIIVYDHALSSAERDAVGTYLDRRYAFVPATPAAPTVLMASAVSDTQVSLVWQGTLSTAATVFSVERKSGAGSYAVITEVTNELSYIDATAVAGTNYTYRVKARNLAGSTDYSNEATVTTPSAGSPTVPMAGMRLWLKADTLIPGAALPVWRDQSGLGNDAVQAAPINRPLAVASGANGRPAVRFDGSNTFLLLPNFMATATAGEAFVVLRTATTTLTHHLGLWSLSGDSYYPLQDGTILESFGTTQAAIGPVPTQPLDQFHLYNISAQNGAWASWIDKVGYVTRNANTVPTFTSSAPLGTVGGQHFAGDIAEIIIYDHALSAAEREAVGYYLNGKFAFAPPTTFAAPGNGPSGSVDPYNGRAFVLENSAGVGTATITYSYDASGRVLSAGYGTAMNLQFTHDSASNLSTAAGYDSGGPIVAWRTAHNLPANGTGLGADLAIISGDRLPNLAKYAFGLNPNVAYTANQPAVSTTNVAGSNYLTLTYQRPDPAPTDIIYAVEVSGDYGATWSSGASATVAVSTTVTNGIATVIVRDAMPISIVPFGRQIRITITRVIQ